MTITLDDTAAIAAAVRNPATSALVDREELTDADDPARWAVELYQLIPIGHYAEPWVVVTTAEDETEFYPEASFNQAEAVYDESLKFLRQDYAETFGDHELGDPDDDDDQEDEDSMRTLTRNPWAQARTVADLGELTAKWLEGDPEIKHPGYHGAPAAETAPLVPVLAAANRAGILTITSQPGHAPEAGSDGAVWAQFPGVLVIAAEPVIERLEAAAGQHSGLVAYTTATFATRRTVRDYFAAVTTRDGEPVTQFGLQSWRTLYRVLGATRNLPGALRGTHQAVIVDQVHEDRPTLWNLLAEAAG